MSGNSKFINKGILFLCCWSIVHSPLSIVQAKERTLLDLPHAYHGTQFQFFPIPYFETDPAAGQRYGLMPTFLWYDKADQLITIGLTALTFNEVVGVGGFVGTFFYPSEKEMLELFITAAQNYERDYYLHYDNETWGDEKLDVDIELEYSQDPFERFFGLGPQTPKSDESNFVSHLGFWKGRFAYAILPKFDVQLEEKWMRLTLFPRALSSVKDTAVFFSGNPEVTGFNQWLHRFSFVWDTRDSKQFPTDGHYLESYGLFSHSLLGDSTFYSGYGFSSKKVFTLQKRFTTVARFFTEQLFGGTIPFYMQEQLGGRNDLRGFVKRRFTGRGKILFGVEERILVKSWHVMNAKFDFSVDPFFSVGQVFNQWGEVRFNNLQPIGGIGFRALVPPAVVGRVDVGIAGEGVSVYTTLGYPF